MVVSTQSHTLTLASTDAAHVDDPQKRTVPVAADFCTWVHESTACSAVARGVGTIGW